MHFYGWVNCLIRLKCIADAMDTTPFFLVDTITGSLLFIKSEFERLFQMLQSVDGNLLSKIPLFLNFYHQNPDMTGKQGATTNLKLVLGL